MANSDTLRCRSSWSSAKARQGVISRMEVKPYSIGLNACDRGLVSAFVSALCAGGGAWSADPDSLAYVFCLQLEAADEEDYTNANLAPRTHHPATPIQAQVEWHNRRCEKKATRRGACCDGGVGKILQAGTQRTEAVGYLDNAIPGLSQEQVRGARVTWIFCDGEMTARHPVLPVLRKAP